MSWSYLHNLIGTRLEGSLLFMETISFGRGTELFWNFWGKSYIFNTFIFEETVNCFSADFQV